MSTDTACSSSLVAAHLATRGLANGETTAALAGGVNVMLLAQTTARICLLQASLFKLPAAGGIGTDAVASCWLQAMLLCPDHTRANSWCDCTGHWTSEIACMPCCEPKPPCVVLAPSGHSSIALPPTRCDPVAGHGVHVAVAANASAFRSWKSLGIWPQALSPVGRCKTFDATGDGYGRGEGFAIALLRCAIRVCHMNGCRGLTMLTVPAVV